MLVQTASSELPLLVFTLLVPLSIVSLSLVAFVRGFLPAEGDATTSSKKVDVLSVVAVGLMLIGLVASFLHLGSPIHASGMLNKLGTSPLSNEIAVAGASIFLAVAYWVFNLVKHPSAGMQKVFSLILLACGLLTALFTGLAYAMPTIPTWDTPYATMSQLGLALLGGASLAAAILSLANYETSRKTETLLFAIGIVGCVLMIASVFLQGSVAGAALSSDGTTLASTMSDYNAFSLVAIALALVGMAAWLLGVLKMKGTSRGATVSIGFVLILIALVLFRICYYGIYLNVGLL